MRGIESLEFRVEVWDEADNRLEELIALCANSILARGAYEAALKLRPRAKPRPEASRANHCAGAGIGLTRP
jgi:hypothetical protein